jgi:hypothetical protein
MLTSFPGRPRKAGGETVSAATAAVVVSVGALIVSAIVAVRQQSAGNSASWWNRVMDALQLTASNVEHQRRAGWILISQLSGSRLRSREDRRIAEDLLFLWEPDPADQVESEPYDQDAEETGQCPD